MTISNEIFTKILISFNQFWTSKTKKQAHEPAKNLLKHPVLKMTCEKNYKNVDPRPQTFQNPIPRSIPSTVFTYIF